LVANLIQHPKSVGIRCGLGRAGQSELSRGTSDHDRLRP
jgi:hypothetical protein